MDRRFKGILKCLLILGADAGLLCYIFNDWRIVTGVICCIALYAFVVGESLAPLQYGAIRIDNLDHFTKAKLSSGFDLAMREYENKIGKSRNIVAYLIPDDSEFNAFAFGRKKVGITQDALRTLDSYSIAAVLSHEFGHVEGLDVCVKRLLFANLLGLLVLFGITGIMWIVIAFIFFIIMAWIFDSFWGFYLGLGIFKGLSKIGKGVAYIILSVAQAFILLIDRKNEYAADEFAVFLGFGNQLSMILERYVGETAPANSLADLMYATHPKTRKRIARIEKKLHTELMIYKNIME